MTLAELQAKYEGVLLSAPLLAAELAEMVQDERADERRECGQIASKYTCIVAKLIVDEIDNRSTKESTNGIR